MEDNYYITGVIYMRYCFLLICCIILTGCNPPMIVTRDDLSTVTKCWDGFCENFIVFKSKYDKAKPWYGYGVTCKHMREKKHLAYIVDKQHPDYEYYKLKYEACKQGVKDFNKFYSWYMANKEQYFEYVISETIFESTHPINEDYHIDNSTYSFKPIYEEVKKPVVTHIGKVHTYKTERRKQLVEFKPVKHENIQSIPAGTTSCRTKVTIKVDAMTYYIKKIQK